MARSLALLFMLTVTSGELLAEEATSKLKVGDEVFITLEGEAAELYSRCRGVEQAKTPPGAMRQVQVIGTVRAIRKDGTVGIEHSAEYRSPARMIVLRGTVKPESLEAKVTPKGTAVYSAPGSDPVLTKEDSTSYRVAIKELKGFKLRAWTVEEEFGDETAEAEAIVPFRYRMNGPWRN